MLSLLDQPGSFNDDDFEMPIYPQFNEWLCPSKTFLTFFFHWLTRWLTDVPISWLCMASVAPPAAAVWRLSALFIKQQLATEEPNRTLVSLPLFHFQTSVPLFSLIHKHLVSVVVKAGFLLLCTLQVASGWCLPIRLWLGECYWGFTTDSQVVIYIQPWKENYFS